MREQLFPSISLDKLHLELRALRLQEQVSRDKAEHEAFLLKRQQQCEKLYHHFKRLEES